MSYCPAAVSHLTDHHGFGTDGLPVRQIDIRLGGRALHEVAPGQRFETAGTRQVAGDQSRDIEGHGAGILPAERHDGDGNRPGNAANDLDL